MKLRAGWIEKRRHDRKTAAWEVAYQVIGPEEATALCREYRASVNSFSRREAEAGSRALTHDLSVTGLAVIGPQPLAAGTKLLLYLRKSTEQPSLAVVAEVVHCGAESSHPGSFYRMGMRILGVEETAFRRAMQAM